MALRSYSSTVRTLSCNAQHLSSAARRRADACKMPPPASPSISNKTALVFHDEAKGIVCYRSVETGEVTCEGFDEGPYFDGLPSSPSPKSQRACQNWSSPKNTRCNVEPRRQWDNSLQMFILEGFDEG